MVMRIPVGNLIIGVAAFAVFTFEGCRQIYRARHVDRLEQEGKIPADTAARIRKKPMILIGSGLIVVGIFFLLKEVLQF